jgi:hypothetical protein
MAVESTFIMLNRASFAKRIAPKKSATLVAE